VIRRHGRSERLLTRVAREFGQRGLLGFAGKLLSLAYRRRAYVLFELDCKAAAFPAMAEGERVELITARNIERDGFVESSLVALNAENADYLDDVARDRAVGLVVLSEGRVVHHGFLFKKNRTACLLGLRSSAALIGNAFTIAAYRGQGCQARSVQTRACLARDEGFRSVVAESSPDNLASQGGMRKAGMHLLGPLDIVVLLNCLVIRWRRPQGFRLFGICL